MAASAQESGKLSIQASQPGIKISPLFYGLMTEEINYSYEGGLYAELVRNRVLKNDAKNPAHWSLLPGSGAATMSVDTSQPVPGTELTHALRLDLGATQSGGVSNEGFWGIPVKPNTTYTGSLWAKRTGSGPLTVSLESNDGQQVFATRTVGVSGEWKKYSFTLRTGAVAASKANKLAVRASGGGSVWMTQVSLFPPTYKNRPNGLRPDLMQMMAAMKPSYLRFPGGNYLEGNTIAERFDWKKTLGPIEQRPGHQGPWGYRSSDGMGMMEFLGWCEDLGVEPLLGLFAGYALGGEVAKPGPALEPFIQDALDEIEYVTGPVTSTWGAKRARDGHPAPFKLRYVEIGNEDWFDKSGSYDGRFAAFHDAIKKRYPSLQTIATAPVKSRVPDVIDDHYYLSSREMARTSNRYDNTDRKGPKIFVGEWASQGDTPPWEARAMAASPTPNMEMALGDAAWLTGMERNSDHVIMQCYAPLLVNVNPGGRQWSNNLIGYDALSAYGSPSYWAQVMFAQHTGDTVLPSEITIASAGAEAPRGQVGLGTWNTQAEFKDVRVTAPDGKALYSSDFAGGTGGFTAASGDWASVGGALRQSGNAENTRAVAGDVSWQDYTISLKARKISGDEGFLVLFRSRDAQNFSWWNIGGWKNTRTTIERSTGGAKSEVGGSSDATVETGRWYDLRLEVSGNKIRGFIDGKLVSSATDAPPSPVYAAASRDSKSGDTLLKVVNTAAQPYVLQVEMAGGRNIAPTARAQVLVGEPAAVNTIEEPTKLAPRTVTISGLSRSFRHSFPAHSVTVMRLKSR